MIRKSLVATVIAGAAVLATPAVADARPVPDQPLYCGPTAVQVGARCESGTLPPDEGSYWSAVAAAGVGVLGLLGLVIL